MSATTIERTEMDPEWILVGDLHTDEAVAYARTIHQGLENRERRVLAAVYSEMPCTIGTAAEEAGVSRSTAQRAVRALEALELIERTDAGLVVHAEAIGAVDAWAHRHGPMSERADWWTRGEPTVDAGGRFNPDSDDWPDAVFPDPALDWIPGIGDLELAARAVEHRRVPVGRGARIPAVVLDYAAEATSLRTVKVALECGRRATRGGVAEFHPGELGRVTGLTATHVSDALADLRQDGVAEAATPTRVELIVG